MSWCQHTVAICNFKRKVWWQLAVGRFFSRRQRAIISRNSFPHLSWLGAEWECLKDNIHSSLSKCLFIFLSLYVEPVFFMKRLEPSDKHKSCQGIFMPFAIKSFSVCTRRVNKKKRGVYSVWLRLWNLARVFLITSKNKASTSLTFWNCHLQVRTPSAHFLFINCWIPAKVGSTRMGHYVAWATYLPLQHQKVANFREEDRTKGHTMSGFQNLVFAE